MITKDQDLMLAPKFSNRRTVGQCEPVVAWVKQPEGTLMMAPHTQAPIPESMLRAGWTRVEYTTVREIEAFSRRFAAQQLKEEQHKKVEAHLRHAAKLRQMRTDCRLRIAQSYSKNDVEMNKSILANSERRERKFFDFITSDITVHNSALEIEKHESAEKRYTLVGDKKKMEL